MVGIVERMDDEVRGARMLRVAVEDVFGDRRGLHGIAEIAFTWPAESEQRQRIQRRDLVVGWILFVQPLHGRRVQDVARVFVARAVQHVDRFDEIALLAGRCFRGARRGRRREALEDFPRRGDVLLRPERMIEAHRLAPIGKHERRIRFLRFAEGIGSRVELEVVQRFHAGEERALCGPLRRRRELNRSELAGRSLRRGRTGEETDGGGNEEDGFHEVDIVSLSRGRHKRACALLSDDYHTCVSKIGLKQDVSCRTR